MLFLINDTEVSLNGNSAVSTSQGGTSAFVAGFINHLISKKVNFGLLGNFNCSEPDTFLHQIKARSNLAFLAGLLVFFIKKRLSACDLLYFQRPDHLAFSLFSPAAKVLHLHGAMRVTMKERRGGLSSAVYLFLERIAMSTVQLILTTDHHTASIYKETYPHIAGKIHVIPSGFDYSLFHEVSVIPSKTIHSHAKRLVYAGRLAYPKRLDDMMKAFALVVNTSPEAEFHIAGDGPLMSQVQKSVVEQGLQDKVIFHGILQKNELRDLLHSCHAGILLSHSEGSPISVKEILACGKPVIVSDVGDCKDYVIESKTGYIVDAGNHQQVADAIVKAFTNADFMASDCAEIVKQYDEAIINDRIFGLITQHQK
jgi:glycosyltransferase involved in cell wall biosynthesis